MEFLRIEISYDCGVIKEYRKRTTMSEESLSHIRRLAENMLESKDQIVFSTEPETFRGVGSATNLKFHVPFVKTLTVLTIPW